MGVKVNGKNVSSYDIIACHRLEKTLQVVHLLMLLFVLWIEMLQLTAIIWIL